MSTLSSITRSHRVFSSVLSSRMKRASNSLRTEQRTVPDLACCGHKSDIPGAAAYFPAPLVTFGMPHYDRHLSYYFRQERVATTAIHSVKAASSQDHFLEQTDENSLRLGRSPEHHTTCDMALTYPPSVHIIHCPSDEGSFIT